MESHPPASGCRCPDCFGMAEAMAEITGKDYGLPAAPGHPAVVVTSFASGRCDGTRDCQCERCVSQRATLLALPRRAPRQPWDVQRAA